MKLDTVRFGAIEVSESDLISLPAGLLGFADQTRFCLVDPGDHTLILWLQSVDHPEIAFPVLEPKIFKPDYVVKLSALELKELQMQSIHQSAVFSILTIPEDITQMTANLKAPLVLNLKDQIARQVVLQENEYSVKHPMFQALRTHLITLKNQLSQESDANLSSTAVSIRDIPPSLTVRSLAAGATA